MELLPSPIDTLSEFLENENRIMEGINQQERYDTLAASTRMSELNRLVQNGVASEAERDELVHRMTNNPQYLRMVEAGRAELRDFLEGGSGDAGFVLDHVPVEMRNFILNGDIATLARIQVETEYLKGAVANNMATPEEIEMHERIQQQGLTAFIMHPENEMLDVLQNPESTSIEPHEMMPGFEGLAGVLDSLLDQFKPMLDQMLSNLGMSREEAAQSVAQEMQNDALRRHLPDAEPSHGAPSPSGM